MDLYSLVLTILRKTPLLLVLLAGLAVAVIRWKRHPRVSQLTLLGTGLYILEIFVLAILYFMLPTLLARMGIESDSSIYTVVQVVDDLIYAGILLLLISAAFSQRKRKTVIHL